MKLLVLLALSADCSHPSDSVGAFNAWLESSESSSSELIETPSASGTSWNGSESSSTMDLGSSETSSGDEGPTVTPTPSESSLDDSGELSGELSGDTDTAESELTSGEGWAACDGDVPTACLAISADTGTCPGTPGSCSWHACISDRTTRANIEWLQCLVDECGIEPVVDLDCLDEWADLTLRCFETQCDPATPQACAFVNNGAQHECHR